MSSISLRLGHEHPCDYRPGQLARMLYVPPELPVHRELYGQLLALGFRRSGDFFYRPHCRSCSACIPVRVPVARFAPNRSQRRVLRANREITVRSLPAGFREEHYQLYRRYLEARHPEGIMAQSTRDDYRRFLCADWEGAGFYEFRVGPTLVAVTATDHLGEALSAVYTFYEPDCPERSLGTFAVLWLIEEARRRALDWLYLGFWIKDCRKMAYKFNFRPLEARVGERWVRLRPGPNLSP